jgi:hypothetical protein
MEKRVRETDVIKPRREPAKIKEKVNKRATKNETKNNGIAPNVFGSTK